MDVTRNIQEIEHLLPRIKKPLEDIYGNRLVEIILYGSFARNTPTQDSDIDVGVVLRGKLDRSKEIDRIYDALYDLMLETGELLSIYPVSEEEMVNSTWPLYYHMKTEGIKNLREIETLLQRAEKVLNSAELLRA